MFNSRKKRLDKERAFQKLKHYCGYQERSHLEAKEKLFGLGLYKSEVEEVIARLIDEDYLNEERFAVSYARGKFRMKGWGKVKIIQGLKENQISDYCIKKATKEINEADYRNTLNKFADSKWRNLESESNIFAKLRKTQDYLLQKGYEVALVREVLQELRTDAKNAK